jgi:hypothetical protein
MAGGEDTAGPANEEDAESDAGSEEIDIEDSEGDDEEEEGEGVERMTWRWMTPKAPAMTRRCHSLVLPHTTRMSWPTEPITKMNLIWSSPLLTSSS